MTRRLMIITSLLAALALLLWLTDFDSELSRLIYGLRAPVLTSLMHVISWIGYVYFLVPINILILVLLFKQDRLLALTIPLGTLIVWLTSEILKIIIQRPRPDIAPIAVETSFSFPSGHAMSNTAFYMLLLLLAPRNKYLRAVCVMMIVLMDFSRIYLGVHWPSDVLGGSAIALLIYQLIMTLVKRRQMKIDRE